MEVTKRQEDREGETVHVVNEGYQEENEIRKPGTPTLTNPMPNSLSVETKLVYSKSCEDMREEFFELFDVMHHSLSRVSGQIASEELQAEARELVIIFCERYNILVEEMAPMRRPSRKNKNQSFDTKEQVARETIYDFHNKLLYYFSKIFRLLLRIYKKDLKIGAVAKSPSIEGGGGGVANNTLVVEAKHEENAFDAEDPPKSVNEGISQGETMRKDMVQQFLDEFDEILVVHEKIYHKFCLSHPKVQGPNTHENGTKGNIVQNHSFSLDLNKKGEESPRSSTIFNHRFHDDNGGANGDENGDDDDDDSDAPKLLDLPKRVRKEIPIYMKFYHFICKFLPWLFWIPEYFKGGFKRVLMNIVGDIFAGITVGVMLIPQAMAYSIVAGLPPVHGLYSNLIPMFIYPIFGTSRVVSIGPTAISSLLTNVAVSELMITSPDDTARYMEERIALTFLLAIFVGALRMIGGILRLGFVVNFLSHPVIAGYTSAAAIFIMTSQMNHIFGIYGAPTNSKTIYMMIYQLAIRITQIHWPTLLFASICIVILIFFTFFSVKIKGRTIDFKKIPVPVILVIITTLIMFIIQVSTNYSSESGVDVFGIRIIGKIPEGLPVPLLPSMFRPFDWDLALQLTLAALPIALIGFLESISISTFYAAKENETIEASQELIALGLGGLVSGFFQSFPVTGSFSRTAVNASQGARSQFSSLISAGIVLVTLLFLTPALYFLPMAALASIIIVSCIKLIDINILMFTWKSKKRDFFLAVFTFLTTLFVGTVEGIIIATATAIIFVLFRASRPRYKIEGRIPGTMEYKIVQFWKTAKQTPGIIVARFDADLFFANNTYFKDKTLRFIKRSEYPVYFFILDCRSISQIDSSSIEAIIALEKVLQEPVNDQPKVTFLFAALKIPIRRVLEQSGVMKYISDDRFFDGVHSAAKYAEQQLFKILKDSKKALSRKSDEEEEDEQTDHDVEKGNQDSELKEVRIALELSGDCEDGNEITQDKRHSVQHQTNDDSQNNLE